MSEIKNAVIKNISLTGGEEQGCLRIWLYLDTGKYIEEFGGQICYLPNIKEEDRSILSSAGHVIWRIMQISDVSDWNDITGKTIRVAYDSNHKLVNIGHIVKEDWFDYTADFKLDKSKFKLTKI